MQLSLALLFPDPLLSLSGPSTADSAARSCRGHHIDTFENYGELSDIEFESGPSSLEKRVSFKQLEQGPSSLRWIISTRHRICRVFSTDGSCLAIVINHKSVVPYDLACNSDVIHGCYILKQNWPCREKIVELEATKEVWQKLTKCYLKEGVNHLQNCRDLRLRYLEAIKTVGWGNR
jgi:hypothetical protein